MNHLAQARIFGRFQAQELVSTQDERRTICLALLAIAEIGQIY